MSSQLKHIKAELLQFIFKATKMILTVKSITILHQAARLDNYFDVRKKCQYCAVQSFAKYVYRLRLSPTFDPCEKFSFSKKTSKV